MRSVPVCVVCGEVGDEVGLGRLVTCDMCSRLTHSHNDLPCGYTDLELTDRFSFHPNRPAPPTHWSKQQVEFTFYCAECVLPDW